MSIKLSNSISPWSDHWMCGEQIHILRGQGIITRTEEPKYHLRKTVFEDHLEKDRRAIYEHGLDFIGILTSFSHFLHGGGDVRRG